MTSFRRTRIQRRIALAVLLFWLFALASSWANACIQQDRQAHVHASARAGEPATVTVMAGHLGAVSAQGNAAVSGEASVCVDVYGTQAQTSVQPDQGVGLTDLVRGPPTSLAWTPDVLRRVPGTQPTAAPTPSAAVPPRTLLSRLTL